MNGLLIVDDEEGIRRSIQAALRREGYPIEMAETGKRAVEIVKKNPGAITIVISDFKMPGMDGIETLAAIGNLNPEICRIILTGYATLESAILATKCWGRCGPSARERAGAGRAPAGQSRAGRGSAL